MVTIGSNVVEALGCNHPPLRKKREEVIMEESTSVQTEQDFGELLYEESNAKSALDAPSGRVGAKGWAQRIYIILIGAAMLAWFVYSLINAANQPDVGWGKAIVKHIAAFLLLAMSETILMLTAFNAWGKFARAVFKHKALTRQHGIEGAQTRQLEEELKAADANKGKETAFRMYREHVVLVYKGNKIILNKNEIQSVKCSPTPKGYQLTFCLYDGNEKVSIPIPPIDLPFIRNNFERFDYEPGQRQKINLKKKFPAILFACLPLLLGVGILLLRHFLLNDMPIIFGLVFMSFGVIFVTWQFSEVAVIYYGILTILGGLLLIGLPLGIVWTIVDLVESITWTSVLTTFTPIHSVLSVFLGLGPMMIILGIDAFVKCSRM